MNTYLAMHSPGTTVTWLNTIYTVLLTPAESGGGIGMFSAIVPPNSGPPRHVHRNEDEIIHLIDGDVEFWLEGATRRCSNGETVFIPRGREHAFHVHGPQPAQFLTAVTPGGFESFFASASVKGLVPHLHRAELGALAAGFGCAFTGPPLQSPVMRAMAG